MIFWMVLKNWLLPLAVLIVVVLVGMRIHLIQRTSPLIVQIADVPYHTAIVFGAGIDRNQQPTKVLKDRLDKTIELYENGEINHILVSGGEAHSGSESIIMRDYLIKQGIPPALLSVDEGGVSTYDTLARARSQYGIQEAVLITQRFHLPRALASAQMLGMDVVGVAADIQQYRINSQVWWNFRELFAWMWTIIKTSS